MNHSFFSLTVLALAGLLTGSGMKASAQASASGQVSARIVTPVGISQASEDLNFKMPSQYRVYSGPSAILQKCLPGSANSEERIQAVFNISGRPNYAYSVSVPQYISVEQGNKVLTLIASADGAQHGGKLSQTGEARVEVECNFVSANIPKQNLQLAYNDEDETYFQNCLPVLINYN